MALEIGRGDCVVTTPFTFFATAGAAVRAGARLAFADIERSAFNITAATVEQALERVGGTCRRLVILPVHLYGQMAPMEELCAFARRRGAHLVEDAAQSVGARSSLEGRARMAGTWGDLGALSFFPSKNLGAAGDGGMVLCDDDVLAARVRMLRVHGSRRRYHHDEVGLNSRLDSLQAALLRVKLRRLDEWNARRRARAALYSRRFRELGLDPGPVQTPAEAGEEHVFHQYVIRAERRDRLREALAKAEIETQIYYPIPLHEQPCFAELGYRRGDFPESERACGECLALPIYPELHDDQIEHVVASVASFYGRH
jgi:dTDP-4-amino-4,6-dideoxygalactose transaminase